MEKTALLIIDMQNDFCLPQAPFAVKGALQVAGQIKKALEACRLWGLPVVHVVRRYRADGVDVEITRLPAFLEKDGAFMADTKGTQIIGELKPVKGEYVVIKRRWSAFFQTELDLLLRRLKVNHIVVAGVQTPNCIRSTVWDANSLDYQVTVLTDGTGAADPDVHRANLFDMQNIGIQLMTVDELVSSLYKGGTRLDRINNS